MDLIAADETLVVDQTGGAGVFTTVNAALDSLTGSLISGAALVTIEVQPGTHPHTESIVLSHPSGDRIQIIGVGSPILDFSSLTSGNALNIGFGNVLGYIDGVTLFGGSTSPTTTGIGVHRQGWADVGADVDIRGFATGFAVSSGGGRPPTEWSPS